jgi:DNA-directed RNA polymerase subunit E'/Rpb7
MLGKCNQEHGYIVKIYDKIKIIDNKISPASLGIFFNVKFGIKAIKPEVNGVYKGVICMCFGQGIFVEIFEKVKALIPADKLGLFKWDKMSNTFKNGDKSLKCKDEVEIEINMIRYEKSHFNCIGSLKNTDI